MEDNLNPQQISELAVLAQEAKAARSRAAQKVTDYVEHERNKETVTPAEYRARLHNSMKRDQSIVQETKEQRIQMSLSNWKDKVGPTFAGATTDNPKILDRVSRLQTKSGRHKTSLVFHGNLGVGKSWSSYAFINLAIAAGAVTAAQVIADTETSVLGRISSGGYKKVDMLEELVNARNQIYFIDDVGQGFFSTEQGRTEVWFELIDHIYTHQLTLLITTNKQFTERSLGAWIGMRAFDRLKALVGPDGLMEPSKVNRRESVLERQEETYSHDQNQNR